MKPTLLLPILGSLMANVTPGLLAAGTLAAPAPNPTPSATPLPVLMVLPNQDFYYREYSDTRRSLEASGLAVRVAAAATTHCSATPGTGQPAGSLGVSPDLPLTRADAGDYSAVVFVGGWGASMYQYSFNDPDLNGTVDSFYVNPAFNGDNNLTDGKVGETKVAVNELINDFIAQDKYVSGLCHGVSVLAWARVDGASPLKGKKVAASQAGSPAASYLGRSYANNELSVHHQVVGNGGFANPYSGQYGDPTTVADDVIVDGRIITGENYESASLLGRVLASQILKR